MSDYKKEAIRAAKELGYGKETINKIRKAKKRKAKSREYS